MTLLSTRRRRLMQAVTLTALAPALISRAASYPAKPVRLVIPFPAGGATDYAARAVGQALAERWNQPVVFDNRSGAGSTIGTQIGAKSAPDGYTIVMGIPAGVSIAPHIYPNLGYDPLTDLIPITGFASSPLVVLVPTDSPFKTLSDLLTFAKANPGKLSYASNGAGSLPHLTTEWLLSQAKVQVMHVPYRGSAQALPDLVAGRTNFMIDIIVSGLPLVEGGKLRALAVTGPQRTTLLANVPTVAQSGFPGFAVDQWYGFFAPVGTPTEIVQQVAQDVKVVTESTRLRGLMWQRGAEVSYLSGPAFASMVQKDWQRWKTVAASTGARAQ